MIQKVRTYPDKVLREKCVEYEKEELEGEEFLKLMQDMVDTLGHFKALGLAAPQIGVNKRVFITNVDNRPQFFINPRIVRAEGSITGKEGCLSFPNVFKQITRPNEVTIHAIDVDGREFVCELDGMDATAAQHELDHLDGVLFIDKVSQLKKGFMLKKLAKTKKKYGIK